MDTKEQSSGKSEFHDTVVTDRSGFRCRNFNFDELGRNISFVGLGFAPPVEKALVTELMLPTKRGSSESGLIELCEPMFALLLGESSRRHAEQDTSIDSLGEIIPMGLLGPLHPPNIPPTPSFDLILPLKISSPALSQELTPNKKTTRDHRKKNATSSAARETVRYPPQTTTPMIRPFLEIKFSPSLFPLFGIAVLIQGTVIAFLHHRRKKRGLKFPAKNDTDVLFYERFGSGSSYRSWLTRLGGAQRCLTVIVTKTHLHLTSFFPFNLILPFYDLEHSIPRSRITNLTTTFDTAIITFNREDGREEKLKIRLWKTPAFLIAIESQPLIDEER